MLPTELAGKYELRGTLGAGAMGTVLDAFDRMIERRVAVKLVKLPGSGDAEADEAHARFRREAQAAGRLSHPNIVGVYDYGENADTAWIVMELVEGGTLKALLDRRERFPVAEIARVMEQVLAALAYSHGRGVVHRDIKPANIMLSADGTIKIADFGIARIESSTMTQVGTVMGTPSYMAPEQLRGETVDARADLWAAGVLLYQLLTGEKPFDGGYSALMHRVLNTEPPPPSQLSVNAPRAFDAVVARALAKRPEDRFPTAAAFAEAIHAAANATPASAEAGQSFAAGFADAGKLPGLDDGTMMAGQAAAGQGPSVRRPPAAPPKDPSAKAGSKLPLVLGGLGALAAAGIAAFLLMPGASPPPAVVAVPNPAIDAASGTTPVPATIAVAPPPASPQLGATTPVTPSGPIVMAPAPVAAPPSVPATGLAAIPTPAQPPATISPAATQPAPVMAPLPAVPTVTSPAPAVQAPVALATPGLAAPPGSVAPLARPPAPPPLAALPAPVVPQAPITQDRPANAEPAPRPAASVEPRPSQAAPAQIVPGQPAPQQTLPAQAAPSQAAPSQSAPAQSAPAQSAPAQVLPGPVIAALPTPTPTPPLLAAPAPAALAVPRPNFAAAAFAAASAAPCSLLEASATDRGVIVQGVLRRGGEAAIQRALSDAGVLPSASVLRLTPFDGPYCGALDVIRQVTAEAGAAPLVQIIGRQPLQKNDLLRLDVVMPPRAGQLYVSYLMKSNEIAHLVPSHPQPAGARVRLGEPTPGFPGWEVDEPFGTDMIIVFASERPLFPQPRPMLESLDDFLPALASALRNARAEGVRVSARAIVLETVERR